MDPLYILFLIPVIITIGQPAGDDTSGTLDESRLPGSRALDFFPVIDGHNDLPWNLRNKLSNNLNLFDFASNLSEDPIWGIKNCDHCATDIPRLKAGKVGGQFWVAYADCKSQYVDAVRITLEQIDVIKNLIHKYPDDLEFVKTSDEILKAIKKKKIASLIAVEGGHLIDNSLSVLRMYYELGVRYLTITHVCNTPWADGSPIDKTDNYRKNLTDFGKKIVIEMNRLGMMVDLSHVSYGVMSAVLNITKAPVIFSHSSAYSVYPHHRNVRDDILRKVKQNGGIVMVNFYKEFVGNETASIDTVIEHINHIVEIAGINHVGLGSDFDGVNSLPEGLEDTSKFPALFDALKKSNPKKWSLKNLEKLSGRNIIRVFKKVEEVRDQLKSASPDYSKISKQDYGSIESSEILKCSSDSI